MHTLPFYNFHLNFSFTVLVPYSTVTRYFNFKLCHEKFTSILSCLFFDPGWCCWQPFYTVCFFKTYHSNSVASYAHRVSFLGSSLPAKMTPCCGVNHSNEGTFNSRRMLICIRSPNSKVVFWKVQHIDPVIFVQCLMAADLWAEAGLKLQNPELVCRPKLSFDIPQLQE